MSTPQANLKLARRGPIVSISVYLLLALAKLISGHFVHSASLIADGFNNISDIIANLTILIGLYLASRPADNDHRFGHWKIEDLASLITSFIMFTVGFQVLIETVNRLVKNNQTAIDPIGAWVGAASALLMYGVYFYNRRLYKETNSAALNAAAKDNLSDAATSLGTSLSILASAFNFPIVDKIAAIIITVFILKTAYDIFAASAFSLSDGFDEIQLQAYEKAILEIPEIYAVKSKRGRTYGSNVFLDLVLEMNPDLSVYESHAITEEVEKLLQNNFNVYDTDIHVEPAPIPEDEIFNNVFRKLHHFEKTLQTPSPDREELISENLLFIGQEGQKSPQAFLKQQETLSHSLQAFTVISVSQKSKLVSYESDNYRHTSLWRRNKDWALIFHQITPKK
ncbi:cation diffusion facilitator family transporter [Streptococcus ferus]|uniref:cation diffusion facilitator family transporter n=1 Tax=Streptococcus ferus TaxID=1345 RepID=UPI0035A02A09